jgi:hypothetical protein
MGGMNMLEVGKKVWVFDINRRVYQDEEGNKTTAPWYRGHFVEKYVIGENKTSWILGSTPDCSIERGKKYAKADAHRTIITSEEEIDQRCWVKGNAYKLSELVIRCNDYETLKAIESLLGGAK